MGTLKPISWPFEPKWPTIQFNRAAQQRVLPGLPIHHPLPCGQALLTSHRDEEAAWQLVLSNRMGVGDPCMAGSGAEERRARRAFEKLIQSTLVVTYANAIDTCPDSRRNLASQLGCTNLLLRRTGCFVDRPANPAHPRPDDACKRARDARHR
jgi:hypothetical protein